VQDSFASDFVASADARGGRIFGGVVFLPCSHSLAEEHLFGSAKEYLFRNLSENLAYGPELHRRWCRFDEELLEHRFCRVREKNSMTFGCL
jgi:hypothetical protein